MNMISDTTLHTDEELRSAMFDGDRWDEKERTHNFHLGADEHNQTNSKHGMDGTIQPTKHGMEFNFQMMAR